MHQGIEHACLTETIGSLVGLSMSRQEAALTGTMKWN